MSKQKRRVTFTGQGFDKSEFTEDERAQMRERGRFFDESFLEPDAFLAEAGLLWLSRAAKAAPGFIKMFGAFATIGAGYAALKAMGWL